MRTSRRWGAHLGDPPTFFSLHEFDFDFSKKGSKEEGEIWFSQPYLIVEFANALIDSGAFQEACRGGRRTEKATTVNSASVFTHKVRIAATAQKESR